MPLRARSELAVAVSRTPALAATVRCCDSVSCRLAACLLGRSGRLWRFAHRPGRAEPSGQPRAIGDRPRQPAPSQRCVQRARAAAEPLDVDPRLSAKLPGQSSGPTPISGRPPIDDTRHRRWRAMPRPTAGGPVAPAGIGCRSGRLASKDSPRAGDLLPETPKHARQQRLGGDARDHRLRRRLPTVSRRAATDRRSTPSAGSATTAVCKGEQMLYLDRGQLVARKGPGRAGALWPVPGHPGPIAAADRLPDAGARQDRSRSPTWSNTRKPIARRARN